MYSPSFSLWWLNHLPRWVPLRFRRFEEGRAVDHRSSDGHGVLSAKRGSCVFGWCRASTIFIDLAGPFLFGFICNWQGQLIQFWWIPPLPAVSFTVCVCICGICVGILESSRREDAHSPSVRKGYQHSIPLAANQLDTQAASGNPISHRFVSCCFTLSHYWKLPSFVRYWFCTSDFAMRMLGRWKTISQPWGHGERFPPGVRDANEWQSNMMIL